MTITGGNVQPLDRIHPDRMRIVHVITRLIIGGAQENTLLTVDGLHHRHGDDVTLITGPAEGPEGDLFDRAERRGLKVELMPELVRPIRPLTDLRAYRRLRRAFRRLRPEVVHTHSCEGGASSAGPPPGTRRCRPSSTRSTDRRSGRSRRRLRNRLYLMAERWAARRCHAMVSVCDAMTEQYLAAGVGRPEQYQTVYSGMDVEAFLNPPRPRDEVRRELGLADDRRGLRHRRPAVREQGARRHPRGRPARARGQSRRSGSSSSATASIAGG